MDWANFDSGDSVAAPAQSGSQLEPAEILRRVAVGFRRVIIDWTEGDRYVEARINKAVEVGYSGILLEAEQAMRGRMVLVSVADDPDPDAVWVRFHLLMTLDEESNDSLDLNYLPGAAVVAGRALAVKLAGLLGYEFDPWEGDEDAEPDAAPDRRGR